MNDLALMQRLTRGLDAAHQRIAALEHNMELLANAHNRTVESNNAFMAAVMNTPPLREAIFEYFPELKANWRQIPEPEPEVDLSAPEGESGVREAL